MKRTGKRWSLVFPFVKTVKLPDIPIQDESFVPLIWESPTMQSVQSCVPTELSLPRKFINLASEKDHLYTSLNRQKKAQQNGNHKTPVLWKHVSLIKIEISRKTAKGIIDFACAHQANVIVFEHLAFTGREKGSKKQRLALWRKKEIQKMVEHQAHKNNIRISRICARDIPTGL